MAVFSASSAAKRLWHRVAPSAIEGDDDTSRAARILFTLVIVGLAIDAVMGLAVVIFYPVSSYLAVFAINGPRILVFAGILVLMRFGWVRLASTVFVFSLWAFTSFGAWMEGGLRSPMLTLFFPLILIAALLLGRKAAVLVTALCVGSAIGFFLMERTGVFLAGSAPPSAERFWSGYLVSLTIVVVVAMLGNSELRRSNRALRLEIEERRALEAQLQHAQRMEAVGRLASGLAHDVKNHLMVISAHSEALQRQAGQDHAKRARVGQIMEVVYRASELVQRLLVFSRSDKPNPREVDLNRLIEDTVGMLQPTISAEIELQTRLSPTLGPVRADPTRIQQVLLNLAINACDAMPDGGVLCIETASREVGPHDAMAPGRYAVITVQDSGEGMEQEVQSRAFEPFFTTKIEGVGTGLGLAVVRGIIKEADGHISLKSEPGRGTTFMIHLPCAPFDAQSEVLRPTA